MAMGTENNYYLLRWFPPTNTDEYIQNGALKFISGTSSARPTNIRQVSGSVVSCTDGLAVTRRGGGFQNRFFAEETLKLSSTILK